MDVVNIIDYKYYKIVCILYLIFIIIIFNTNILSYIFGNNIKKQEIKLFGISVLICGFVMGIFVPIIKIKLYELSKRKKLNKEKLYDLLQTIKINKNIENILNKLTELIPLLCFIMFIYLSINNNNINIVSYFYRIINNIYNKIYISIEYYVTRFRWKMSDKIIKWKL